MDHPRGDGTSLLTKLGVGALKCNSALAAYRSRGDPSSLAFVAAAYTALLLLLHSLRRFERAPPADRGRIKAAVWALTTLLTVILTPLMPPVVVWIMAVERARGGDGAAGRNNMAGPYSALARVSLAVVACTAALDAYDGRLLCPVRPCK
ncbi:unnamed protein product [Urochloa humidicola]